MLKQGVELLPQRIQIASVIRDPAKEAEKIRIHLDGA